MISFRRTKWGLLAVDAADDLERHEREVKARVAETMTANVEARARGAGYDPRTMPNVVCGDGSPYRMSYRPATGASQGLLLYFRGGGGCSDYVTCWGVDGRGGMGRRVGTMENTRNTESYGQW